MRAGDRDGRGPRPDRGHDGRDPRRRAGDRGLSRRRGLGMSLLAGEAMTGGYGGADILRGVSVAVEAGEIAAIVGPNGAGKSTAMKALLGLLPLREGRVTLGGDDITRLAPEARVARGIAMVPQTRNVFPSLSVAENLEMGAYLREDALDETMAEVFALFPVLADKARQRAGELSGGQRQQVAVGRALMARPSVLLLDEPTAGVSPIVMDELFERIAAIARTGIAVMIVEQNARQALAIADRGYVLVTGENRFTGTGAALLADPDVRRSFLGG
ncbi:MAG: ABC transporter ATP-binding protein [Pseudomonadota bacterium]